MAYAHIRKLTFDPSVVGASDHADLAVVVRGESYHATIGNGGEQEHAQGYDRAYFLDLALTMPLDFETEPGSYNAATGDFVDHVRIPSYSHTAPTEIYEAHGDAGISTFQGNVTGTWDSAYTLVEHFSEVGGTLTPSDSSAAGNTGALESPAPSVTTGKLGVAGAFAGGQSSVASGGGVTIPDAASLSVASRAAGFTLSAWVNLASTGTGTILSKYRDGGFEYVFGFVGTDLYAWIYDDVAVSYMGRIASGVAAAGQWDYYVYTWADPNSTPEATDHALYQNAAQVDTSTFNPFGIPNVPRDSIATFGIGNWSDGTGAGIVGAIDEVRFSQVARSADWVTATYNLQNNPAACYTVSGELATSGNSLAVAASLPSLTAAVTATVTTRATVAASLPSLTAAATASVTTRLVIGASLPSLTASGTASVTMRAAITASLPSLSASANIVGLRSLTVATLLPALTAHATVAAAVHVTVTLLGAVRDVTPRVLVWDLTPDVRAADLDVAVAVSDRTPSTLVTEVQ